MAAPHTAPISASTTAPLHGRVAIVTGASRGIGREIAAHLASLGANLVIGYTTNSALADQLASEINGSSSSTTPGRLAAVTARVDVSSPEDVKALFDRAEEAFGGLKPYILVNSAGISDPKFHSVASIPLEVFESIFAVNSRGAFLCCREAAARLVQGGGGRIIMITSSAVANLRPGSAAYASSKAAVETMVKIMAKELRGTGITVNCVAPGPVASDMFFAGRTPEQVQAAVDICPLGRLGVAKDVAPVVGFLASDAGEWVNGQVIRVNGGYI